MRIINHIHISIWFKAQGGDNRRSAWPLRKDGMHKPRRVNIKPNKEHDASTNAMLYCSMLDQTRPYSTDTRLH